KAVAAVGRLRASAYSKIVPQFPEARPVGRREYAGKLRVSATQAYSRMDPVVALERISASGIDRKELILEPIDPDPNVSVIRQRRYARLKLSRNVTFFTTNLRENFKLVVPELNLGGGIGAGDRHLAP